MKYIVGEGFFFTIFIIIKHIIETLHNIKCSDTTDTREPNGIFNKGVKIFRKVS